MEKNNSQNKIGDSQKLRERISELKIELEYKDNELRRYFDRIEELEDTIMKLEVLIPEQGETEEKKQSKREKMLLLQLEDKDKELRELKNRMGFLRKEKIQLQQKCETLSKDKNNSASIIIEEKKEPFETLVNELQDKINKQQILIKKLKSERNKEEINQLKEQIILLKEKLDETESLSEKRQKDFSSISKKKYKKLKKALKKANKQNFKLKKKLNRYKNKKTLGPKDIDEIDVDELYFQVDSLKTKLASKENEIKDLNNHLSAMKEEIALIQKKPASSSSNVTSFSTLTEELQSKLNKSKLRIETLEHQLSYYKKLGIVKDHKVNQDISKGKQKLVPKLQKSKNKSSESLNDTESKINEDAKDQRNNIILRIRELETLNEELKKQTSQQREEISNLRNKIYK